MGTAVLTDKEVIALRMRKARGLRIDVKAEADRFACSPETIRKALRGDTFRHLLGEKEPPPQDGPTQAEMDAAFNDLAARLSGGI
jgi:hypothetical protein